MLDREGSFCVLASAVLLSHSPYSTHSHTLSYCSAVGFWCHSTCNLALTFVPPHDFQHSSLIPFPFPCYCFTCVSIPFPCSLSMTLSLSFEKPICDSCKNTRHYSRRTINHPEDSSIVPIFFFFFFATKAFLLCFCL